MENKNFEKMAIDFIDIDNQIKELEALKKAYRTEFETELKRQGTDTMIVNGYTISNKETVSVRLSTTDIKKANPLKYAELMDEFAKEVKQNRFTVKKK